MQRKDVKTILAYRFGIPAMKKLFAEERAELEQEYDSLGSTPFCEVSHTSTTGRPTEQLVMRLEGSYVRDRLTVLSIRERILTMDEVEIQRCLDELNWEYKRLIILRHQEHSSWVRVAMKRGIPESTARVRYGRALERLGDLLDTVPMVDELLERAICARI